MHECKETYHIDRKKETLSISEFALDGNKKSSSLAKLKPSFGKTILKIQI